MRIPDSLKWVQTSVNLHTIKEFFDLKDKLLAMATQYYLMQDFESSINLSTYLYNRLCSVKYKERIDLYKNVTLLHLTQNNIKGALKMFDSSLKCRIPAKTVSDVGNSLIFHFSHNNDIKNLIQFYTRNHLKKQYHESFYIAFNELYWESNINQQYSTHGKVKDLFRQVVRNPKRYNNQKIINLAYTLERYKGLSQELTSFVRNKFTSKTPFDEKTFNNELERFIGTLKRLSDKCDNIAKTKTAEVIVGSYQLLVKNYLYFANNLEKYTPLGQPKEFVDGFKQQMNMISGNIRQQAEKYSNISKNTIKHNLLFTSYNSELLGNGDLNKLINYKYKAKNLLITTDSVRDIQ